ncbi:hypothetical protein C8F04DRAFT_1108164 [Mycena alexandri]|uniref:Uncharacterized protein n=1 Tax=Mycena alexandri TaxID=1745969 RepID=A0AAD6SQR7_9AGAR|nr:hypothetical protein C8F04DRAFT_1108164 [Mycena alexandri]
MTHAQSSPWITSFLGLSSVLAAVGLLSQAYLGSSIKLIILGSIIETGGRLFQWLIIRFRFQYSMGTFRPTSSIYLTYVVSDGLSTWGLTNWKRLYVGYEYDLCPRRLEIHSLALASSFVDDSFLQRAASSIPKHSLFLIEAS